MCLKASMEGEKLWVWIVSIDTPSSSRRSCFCPGRQIALAPTMSPAPPQATINQDSYGGVAGQNIDLCKHFQQPLATVERARCPERLQERCGARQM